MGIEKWLDPILMIYDGSACRPMIEQASLKRLAQKYGVSVLGQEGIGQTHSEPGRSTFHLIVVTRKAEPPMRSSSGAARVRQQADVTLLELQCGLMVEQKVQLRVSRLWWVLKDLGLRRRKSLHAQERDTAEAQQWRQAWWDEIQSLDRACLVFVDESGNTTQMSRHYGRAPGGGR